MKFLKSIKIELKTSFKHQNKAESMQNFIPCTKVQFHKIQSSLSIFTEKIQYWQRWKFEFSKSNFFPQITFESLKLALKLKTQYPICFPKQKWNLGKIDFWAKSRLKFLKILPSTNVKYLWTLRILQETDCTFPG